LCVQEDFYDAVNQTGHIEMFIRSKRSRAAEIETRWTHKPRQLYVSVIELCNR